MSSTSNIQYIAFYLPQFHPIPENDEWWGKGFTEWTNTAKAKPLFHGHYQPHIPADLGFYDLRVPETRVAQAEMAQKYGIDAFCYYHYWFGGKRILERPFNEVLSSGQPDFPFCLCWANETWSGVWHGLKNKILIEQTYPPDDEKKHFDYLLKAFMDKRYLTVDEKPVFLIYRPLDLPDPLNFTDLWRQRAHKAGLKGLYLIGVLSPSDWVPRHSGFDACIRTGLPEKSDWVSKRTPIKWLANQLRIILGHPIIYPYEILIKLLKETTDASLEKYPCIIPNWDNTPRTGSNGLVLHGASPELFKKQIRRAIELINDKSFNHKLIFIKSWNEWAEGNHLEPDLKYGKGYLQVLHEEKKACSL